MPTNPLPDFEGRGLIHDITDRAALNDAFTGSMVTVYVGFDPTADSLHLGNFMGILALRRLQDAGHRPLALVGGSTGMVGDPGGRSEERNLLDPDTLAHNLAGIRSVLTRFLDFDSGAPNQAQLVNNYDWTAEVTVLDFLRDVGKHITVNQMMAKDSVKNRLASENGISFTEFSYQLLQGFDFWWLYENLGCTLQGGGSDQWGNILTGVDLIHKRSGATAHGLTWPLLTRSDGSKFGKTAQGALWLDADKTLPYDLHQYCLRVTDDDVERMLLQLTLLPISEVHAIVAEHRQVPERRIAQRRLADEVVTLVHGPAIAEQCGLAADALFGSDELSVPMFEALGGVVPTVDVAPSVFDGDNNLVALLVAAELCSSNSDARRKLDERQVAVNRVKTTDPHVDASALVDGRFLLLQRGKKDRAIVRVSS